MAGGAVDSTGDHRIAMAMVVASLRARKPIEIENTAQVATSFPSFVDVASSIGFDVMGIVSARP
jgi:3-phosphoshikimate 1-carboxyvinyltransferase